MKFLNGLLMKFKMPNFKKPEETKETSGYILEFYYEDNKTRCTAI